MTFDKIVKKYYTRGWTLEQIIIVLRDARIWHNKQSKLSKELTREDYFSIIKKLQGEDWRDDPPCIHCINLKRWEKCRNSNLECVAYRVFILKTHRLYWKSKDIGRLLRVFNMKDKRVMTKHLKRQVK